MKHIAALLCLALATLVAPPAGHAHGAEPARILIVGDSVTHARDGEYSWRYFLWQHLQDAGARVDFVGPWQGTYLDDDEWGGGYADPDFDLDHASRWGLSMWEVLHAPSKRAPAIGDLVAEYEPDVVVELLGVNDLTWRHLAPAMLDEVDLFVAQARAAKPDVDVVVGTLGQTWIGDTPRFNAAVPGLATRLSTEGSRVVPARVEGFVNGVDTYDPAHPTTDGQRKIAAAVALALDELGVGYPEPVVEPEVPQPEVPGPHDPVDPQPLPPQQPTREVLAPPAQLIPDARQAPSAPRRLRATRSGRRTTVTWGAVPGADRYDVRCGAVRRTLIRAKATLRVSAPQCRVRSLNAVGASPWTKARVRA